jgi:hypothetical protein
MKPQQYNEAKNLLKFNIKGYKSTNNVWIFLKKKIANRKPTWLKSYDFCNLLHFILLILAIKKTLNSKLKNFVSRLSFSM